MTVLSILLPLFLSPLLSLSASASASCTTDDCLRAVQATTVDGLGDCQVFFETFVDPKAVTQTTTTTLTITHSTSVTRVQRRAVPTPVPIAHVLQPRQRTTLIQTSFPPYASPCSNTLRYSSVCTCLGATHTTITDLTPTIIVVRTATTTTTATRTLCASPLPNFILRGSGGGKAGHTNGGDGVVDGAYATLAPIPSVGSAIRFTRGRGNATTFSLTHQCFLNAHDPADDGGKRVLANVNASPRNEPIYFNNRTEIKANEFVAIGCQFVEKKDGKGKKLACSVDACGDGDPDCLDTVLQLCPLYLPIGGTEVVIGAQVGPMCEAFDLEVLEVR